MTVLKVANLLKIYIDESGDFGTSKGSSKFYLVSFVLYNPKYDITKEINDLNKRLKRIGYEGMVHTANLINNRGEYSKLPLNVRKSVFNALYLFAKKIDAKYFTIVIDKKYVSNLKTLKRKIYNEINNMIKRNENYFSKFDKVEVYYDNGQNDLGKVIDKVFKENFENYEHIKEFDHVENRLFQIADMLTYIDKLFYKHKNKLNNTYHEKYFFQKDIIRKIIRDLSKKKL